MVILTSVHLIQIYITSFNQLSAIAHKIDMDTCRWVGSCMHLQIINWGFIIAKWCCNNTFLWSWCCFSCIKKWDTICIRSCILVLSYKLLRIINLFLLCAYKRSMCKCLQNLQPYLVDHFYIHWRTTQFI